MALGLSPASVAGTAGPGTAFTGRSVICSPKKSRAYTGSIFAPAKKGDCSFGPRGSRLTGANRPLRAIRDRCGNPPAHAGTPTLPKLLLTSDTNHRMGWTDLLGLFRFLSVHSIRSVRRTNLGAGRPRRRARRRPPRACRHSRPGRTRAAPRACRGRDLGGREAERSSSFAKNGAVTCDP